MRAIMGGDVSGGVPERTIGAVSKTVVVFWATVGSNPTPSAIFAGLACIAEPCFVLLLPTGLRLQRKRFG